MSKSNFKIAPSPLRSVPGRDAFVEGGRSGGTAVVPSPRALDPNARPNTGIALRLNEYQLEMIRAVAQNENLSIQKLLKSVLMPELERRYREL